jgi:hypothetical protein
LNGDLKANIGGMRPLPASMASALMSAAVGPLADDVSKNCISKPTISSSARQGVCQSSVLLLASRNARGTTMADNDDEAAYYSLRAKQEDEAARSAKNKLARNIHLTLAHRYRVKALEHEIVLEIKQVHD